MSEKKLSKSTYCSAYGCSNAKYLPNCRNKSFFRFPMTKKKLLKIWVNKIKRLKFDPSPYSVLCSDHFDEENFKYQNFTNKRLLKPGAIPNKFCFTKLEKKRKPLDRSTSSTSTALIANGDTDMETSDRERMLDPDDINCASAQTSTFSEVIDEIYILQTENAYLKGALSKKRFTANNIQNDVHMRSMTGFSKEKFFAIYEFMCVEEDLLENTSLSQVDQFFLFFVKLRTGITNEFLSLLFEISDSTVSRYFIHTVKVLYDKLKLLEIWSTRNQINENMPFFIRKKYEHCRVIIDCTEFRIQKSKNPRKQQATFSTYKNANTLKGLIGIAPSGEITYISPLFSGSISDKELFLKSNLLNMLEEGDMVMADKGFRIEKELHAKKCTLITPTFLKDKIQFPATERDENSRVSNTRVHVERAISRIKNFKYFEGDLPYMALHNASKVFFIASILTNLCSPLIKFM